MSASSEYLDALVALSGQKAQAQAQAARQRGQIIGNTLQSLGQIVPQIQQARQQQQDRAALDQDRVAQAKLRGLQTDEAQASLDAVRAGQQDEQSATTATADLFSPQPDGSIFIDPSVAAARMSAAKVHGPTMQKHLAAINDINAGITKFKQDQNDAAATLANSFLQTHTEKEPVDPTTLNLFVDTALQNGMTDAHSAAAVKAAGAQGGDPRTLLTGIRNLSPKFAKDKTPIKLGPNETLVDPTDFHPLAAGNPPAITPEQAATNTRADAAAAETARHNKAMEARPVGGSAAAGTPALTPEAIEDTAVKYRILGTNAIPTRIEGPERVRIMNEASKQIRALGQSAAQSLQKAAAFKADGASLTKMQTMADAASASETKALAQADLVGQLSAKVNRSQSPLWNDWLLSGKKKVLGDQDTTLLFNALDTFTSEYAKIISGSTASVAGASDSATRKAEGLISAALNKGTLQATVDQMKWEMGQTIKGYGATIEHINDRLGSGQTPSSTTPSVAPPTGRYNPATGKVE